MCAPLTDVFFPLAQIYHRLPSSRLLLCAPQNFRCALICVAPVSLGPSPCASSPTADSSTYAS